MSISFSERDLAQISHHGLTLGQVEEQIANFERGFDYLPIDRAAVVGDGIISLSASQAGRYAALYDQRAPGLEIVKFVPASGAATRMFKELFEFISDNKHSKSVEQVLACIDDFAFGDQVEKGSDKEIIESIILPAGLGYGSRPKALIEFHKYPDGARTPAEEHLVEGALYASSNGRARIHFTVSGEHLEGFRKLFDRVLQKYQKQYGVRYDVTFSQQKSSTDTIAVTPDNQPFREADGSLLFRPAGHGALIANLDELDADLLFMKTVDNVQPDARKADTVLYKKALAGMVLELQERSFEWQKKLSEANLQEAAKFVQQELNQRLPAKFDVDYLRKVLDRPLRVCGVVKNEGEPGGGPFWVRAKDGSTSLQIAESAQIDPNEMHLMERATHFNPVDLVMAVKDRNGKKYRLLDYVDPSTGFISSKSKDGKPLKAQELPGLWDGAMADWNTVLVEVPITTFSPVKVVVDLLREQHQPA